MALSLQHEERNVNVQKVVPSRRGATKVRQDVENVIGGLFKVYMDNPEWMAPGPDGLLV